MRDSAATMEAKRPLPRWISRMASISVPPPQ
jgi:hypothetical protein